MGHIYKLFDEDENLLYIGKSGNIKNRIKQHIYDARIIEWKKVFLKL